MTVAAPWVDGIQLAENVSSTARGLLIDGKWLQPASGETIPVIDPSSGREVAQIARGGAVDVNRAVSAARRALDGPWSMLSGHARGKLLWRLADLIDAHREEFAMLETIDGGKPISATRTVDAIAAAEKLRYIAGWAGKIGGETLNLTVAGENHAFTLREPVGVAGLIVPWNFPLVMAVSKLSEALAAGCTTVLKPAEQTSLATLRLGELVQEAGFPEGVVNIVTGYGPEAGQAIADHPGIDKLSFTGSVTTGKRLLAACAGNLKRLTLELGGKSPAFVFGDADFDVAVQGVFRNIFYNAGQVCAAGSRVYAHRSIYDRLVAALAERTEALRIGQATDPATELGPLVSQAQLDRVSAYVEGGLDEGASIVSGGKREGDSGFFFRPTILADTSAAMTVRREEIFGPVLCIQPFEDESLDALAAEANSTEYGLSAYVYTRDLSIAHRMVRRIKAGVVRVNGGLVDHAVPFGGYKASGWGRENGRDGILGFTELNSVVMAI
jgi:phenylacetaldehyde dehydrogenase